MKKPAGPGEILRKKHQYLIPCVYHFYAEPMQIVRGERQYLYDHAGRRYLDCFAGVSVVNCGHCHPDIVRAVCEQAATLQHTTTIYLTQPVVDLAERLAAVTPGRLGKSFFCNSGSEANEGAALLAALATERGEFIALRHALHGRTKLTMSLTGLQMWRADTSPVGGVSFAPSPYCFRCPLGSRKDSCDLACADAVETIIKTTTSGRVAAMFAEPIQGNGGVITPPPGYFKRLREILDRYGVLLVVDEVQTGFGRTGRMFGIEHFGVEPDIMTMAKALANGAPVGAFITTDELAAKFTRPSASTTGGNPVTAAAALATLDVIAGEGLADRAAILGDRLANGLKGLMSRHPVIGDVRGLGLMVGAELIRPDKSPAAAEADLALEMLKDRGFLAGKTGLHRNVLAFQPPLVVGEEDIDSLLTALDDVLSRL
ncbi:aspartate aminotransferase family protein [Anaeroselena agilis]|uniref:alanine--glyoxylate transaminase n=1 Tax=Anaeroselena agilis TaxID=3063788 RepID=A0ABU3NUT9_9FIRM|nr:aspartate aminotransferase family protein [Selenomonadales bacterium 4137-cl]